MATENSGPFWVTGGVYIDVTFTALVPGTAEQYGPFATYKAAKEKWAERTWKTVDDCHARFRIIPETDLPTQVA
jgi:hypothetical protein